MQFITDWDYIVRRFYSPNKFYPCSCLCNCLLVDFLMPHLLQFMYDCVTDFRSVCVAFFSVNLCSIQLHVLPTKPLTIYHPCRFQLLPHEGDVIVTGHGCIKGISSFPWESRGMSWFSFVRHMHWNKKYHFG